MMKFKKLVSLSLNGQKDTFFFNAQNMVLTTALGELAVDSYVFVTDDFSFFNSTDSSSILNFERNTTIAIAGILGKDTPILMFKIAPKEKKIIPANAQLLLRFKFGCSRSKGIKITFSMENKGCFKGSLLSEDDVFSDFTSINWINNLKENRRYIIPVAHKYIEADPIMIEIGMEEEANEEKEK